MEIETWLNITKNCNWSAVEKSLKILKEGFHNKMNNQEKQTIEFYKSEERLPEQYIRVIGYYYNPDNKFEYLIGDVFYGHKSCSIGEAREKGYFDYGSACWRYTYNEEEITKYPVTHWTQFPELPFEKPSVWI